MTKEDVTEDMVDEIESAVGMGCGAWDMVDPREIVSAVVNAAKEWEKSDV